MKKALGSILAVAMLLGLLAACGGNDGGSAGGDAGFKAVMVTDVGGINDESFNQSAWRGMEQLEEELNVTTSFVESEKDADYAPNLEKVYDEGADIIWGIGFLMADALAEAAEANPDQLYALVDDEFEEGAYPNVISVMFHAEESSFLVGYAAAYMTETDHVGFIIGMESPTMDQFKYGYFAGVEYAAAEMGKDIRIDYSILDNFNDVALGKSVALKMYSDGADVIFHAAGASGSGAIEAAKEQDKMVIGVDVDQNHLAPDNVISSGLKNVNVAVYEITERVMNGEELGGTTIRMGLAQNGVGVSTTGGFIPDDLMKDIDALQEDIVAGNVTPPANEADYNAFVGSL